MSVDRILLVSLDNLGDLVFASALAPSLRERFPGAALDIWCKEYTADIARLVPGVRDVIASDPFWDAAPGRGKGSRASFFGALRSVKSRRYAVALLAAAPWRTAAAIAATRIPRRIGLRRRKNSVFLTDALPEENPLKPVLVEIGRLLEPFGISSSNLRYRLDVGSLQDRRDRLGRAIASPYAALHPFASKENRCVALSVWLELSRRLVERGLATLWIGSPRELQRIRDESSDHKWHFIDREGDGSLADTAAGLANATLFVGHDSGPLHVAGAFGVPVVGVFAPGEPQRTFPQGVGPSRMLARPTPATIGVADILREIEALSIHA